MAVDHPTIALAFATLEAGGSRPPASHASDRGLQLAVRVWSGLLADIDRTELLQAVTTYLRQPNSRFFPTPGVLLDLIPSRRRLDDADQAFGELLALAKHGARGFPPLSLLELRQQAPFSWPARVSSDRTAPGRALNPPFALDEADPVRDGAMRVGLSALGGWSLFCEAADEASAADRAAFRAAYRGCLATRAMRQEAIIVERLTAATAPAQLEDQR